MLILSSRKKEVLDVVDETRKANNKHGENITNECRILDISTALEDALTCHDLLLSGNDAGDAKSV